MKDHLDLSKITFYQAIDLLYGSQLEDVTKVVKVLIFFCRELPDMRVNSFYDQAVVRERFKFKDFKFLVLVIYDIDRIRDIYRQCRDYR